MKSFRIFFARTLIALLCSVVFLASCKEEDSISKSVACDILSFKIGETEWKIDGTDITHSYPSAILPTPLTPSIVLSPGATVNPVSGEEQNNFFKDGGVQYVVTAEDRITTKIYTAKAERKKYSVCEIFSFSAGGVIWEINDSLITFLFPPDTRVANYSPIVELSPGARISPLAIDAQNFFTEKGIQYTVTSEDGQSTKIYTVRARIASSECKITMFSVDGQPWEIEGTSIFKVYSASVQETEFRPEITLSEGATIDPPLDKPQNFFVPEGVTYTVTAEDTVTTQTYVARAIKPASDCDIITFFATPTGITEPVEWDVDQEKALITYTFPEGTSTARIAPSISLAPGTTIIPAVTEPQNFFVPEGVTYTVTAENGDVKVYTVKGRVFKVFEKADWFVLTSSNYNWGDDGKGSQDRWPGGHSMLVTDDDPFSGWHSSTDAPFPHTVIIDMLESKRVLNIDAKGDNFNNVIIYLTDDPSIANYSIYPPPFNPDEDLVWRGPDYETWQNPLRVQIPETAPASWGDPVVQGEATNKNVFSFSTPQEPEGRFLILRFIDNIFDDGRTYISVNDITVKGK
jgi:hypothetical protein